MTFRFPSQQKCKLSIWSFIFTTTAYNTRCTYAQWSERRQRGTCIQIYERSSTRYHGVSCMQWIELQVTDITYAEWNVSNGTLRWVLDMMLICVHIIIWTNACHYRNSWLIVKATLLSDTHQWLSPRILVPTLKSYCKLPFPYDIPYSVNTIS